MGLKNVTDFKKLVNMPEGYLELEPGPLSDKEIKEIKNTYELNPEPTGMEALYKKIPTNMRIFGENLFGSTDPITQKDFTNNELIQIIALKKQQEKVNKAKQKLLEKTVKEQDPIALREGKVDPLLSNMLSSFRKSTGKTSVKPYDIVGVDQSWFNAIPRSFTDPSYNVATTLGKYNTYDENGNVRVEDTYNFNKKIRDKILGTGLGSKIGRSLFSPELAGEVLANAIGTEDRPVNFVIKKKIAPLAAKWGNHGTT